MVGAKLATGNDILVDGASLTPTTSELAKVQSLRTLRS